MGSVTMSRNQATLWLVTAWLSLSFRGSTTRTLTSQNSMMVARKMSQSRKSLAHRNSPREWRLSLIEFMGSIAPEVPLTVINNQQYSLLDWANQITSLDNSPLVHSVSYGNDEVQQSSDQYMYTCNTAFMKAGAQGISILFASGDQGVCGRSGCG